MAEEVKLNDAPLGGGASIIGTIDRRLSIIVEEAVLPKDFREKLFHIHHNGEEGPVTHHRVYIVEQWAPGVLKIILSEPEV